MSGNTPEPEEPTPELVLEVMQFCSCSAEQAKTIICWANMFAQKKLEKWRKNILARLTTMQKEHLKL